VRRADNPTTLVSRLSRNPGALTSRTPQGHVGLFRSYFTFTFIIIIIIIIIITVFVNENLSELYG
jgi:hypothetical protein